MPDRPLPKTTEDAAPRDTAPITAIQAYQHAADARRVAMHRVDIVDAPKRIRRAMIETYGPPPVADATLTHELGSPTGTAFKVGFGFTAGVFSFRAIVLAIVVGALLLATAEMLGLLVG